MLQLLESLKRIIERFIVNITPINVAVSAGSYTVPVVSSRRYQVGDEIVIYNQAEMDKPGGEGEIKTIACISGPHTIELCEPLIENYTANDSFTQKLIGGQFLEAIYIGDPQKVSHYPAIAINAKDKSNEWFTLESTTSIFNVNITLYTLAADYEATYRLMHIYAKRIEDALFRSLFPLAEPFATTTLAEDALATDTIVKVSDPQKILGVSGYIWFENWDYLRANRVKRIIDIDNGIWELVFPVGAPMSAGDTVIRPGRHFYDAFPRGIQYGTINAESVVFKAAVLSYMAKEEIKRGVPFIDSLTR